MRALFVTAGLVGLLVAPRVGAAPASLQGAEPPAVAPPSASAGAAVAPAPDAGATAAAPAATPATADRTSLLVLDLTPEGNVAPSTVRLLGELITSELARYRELDVLSNTDVKQMLNLEANRSAMGCDNTSCLADLAGALGARLVVYGSVGELGKKTVLTLNLFDSRSSQSAGREYLEVAALEDLSAAIPGRLRALLARFYADNGLALPGGASAAVEAPAPWLDGRTLMVIGGAGVGVGVIMGAIGSLQRLEYADAAGDLKKLVNSEIALGDLSEVGTARARADKAARDWNGGGLPLVIVGGALAVAGATALTYGLFEVLE